MSWLLLLCLVISTKWRTYRDHRFCDVILPGVYKLVTFLTARRYASAVPAIMVLCMCRTVCHISEFYRNGRTNRAGFWLFSFDLSYTVFLGNSGTSKMRVLPSGTLLQTLDLENSRRRVDGIVIKTRRRSSLWTTPVMVERRGRTRVAYYTSVLQPSNSITSFCCGFDVPLVPTVLQQLTSFHRWPAMMVIPFWQPTIV